MLQVLEISGAGEWTRTTDLSITNALLCQLSYPGNFMFPLYHAPIGLKPAYL